MCSTTSTYGADESQARKVDRIFTEHGDFTRTGKKDTITIHITGASIKSPFTWDLKVQDSSGKTIFFVKRDDSWLDKFYADKGYVDNCSDYMACKQKYYFSDLPNQVFNGLKLSDHNWKMSEYLLKNLRDTVKTFLKEEHVEDKRVQVAIHEMHQTLTSGSFAVLELPVSTVQSEPPRIWVKSVGMFVPFYYE
jgi:hypothetical protein